MSLIFEYAIYIIVIIILVLGIIMLAYRLFLIYFLRDPERKIPSGNVIVSPADGKVIAVVKIENKDKIRIKKGFAGRISTFTDDIGKGPFTAVSIFMSPMDVHVNRSPIQGRVVSIKHSKGKFYGAMKPEAFENEKTETVLDTKIGRIKIIQIAGFLARRIETFINVGDNIRKGEIIGIIKLGSQVTLIMPADKVKINVKKGQRISAGSSIIGNIL